jgi:hypothetical protein
VTALLPLCLAVGCSTSDARGSSPDAATAAGTTLDTGFVARADKACGPYATYNSTHYFRVKGFNRFDPSAAGLTRVAEFLSRNPSYRTLVSDLGRPGTGTKAWSAVMEKLRVSQRLMSNQVRSARQGDVAAFKSNDAKLTENTAALHADLVTLGLPSGSACYGVQGDPLQTAPRSEGSG